MRHCRITLRFEDEHGDPRAAAATYQTDTGRIEFAGVLYPSEVASLAEVRRLAKQSLDGRKPAAPEPRE